VDTAQSFLSQPDRNYKFQSNRVHLSSTAWKLRQVKDMIWEENFKNLHFLVDYQQFHTLELTETFQEHQQNLHEHIFTSKVSWPCLQKKSFIQWLASSHYIMFMLISPERHIVSDCPAYCHDQEIVSYHLRPVSTSICDSVIFEFSSRFQLVTCD
jgi:hypothetical protein